MCRKKDIYNILIGSINMTKNNHYVNIFKLKKRFEKQLSLINQPPQAWLYTGQEDNSILPLYIKNSKFISYYYRQLLLWECIEVSKITYNYDDSSKLYICSTQEFESCFMTKKIADILTCWLYELLVSLKENYKFEYKLTLNTLILDLFFAYIVEFEKNNSASKYQLILIISVYNCINFYNKNNIITCENLTDDEFKIVLINTTLNSCEWDEDINLRISDMIKLNISCC